jgi:hypothetical protein
MSDLITWFRSALDDHERERWNELARIHGSHPDAWRARDGFPRGDFILADIDAKRRVLGAALLRGQQGQEPGGEVFGYHATGMLTAIRMLAEAYADHVGYRDEWRS